MSNYLASGGFTPAKIGESLANLKDRVDLHAQAQWARSGWPFGGCPPWLAGGSPRSWIDVR
jgi:hypothetical protein